MKNQLIPINNPYLSFDKDAEKKSVNIEGFKVVDKRPPWDTRKNHYFNPSFYNYSIEGDRIYNQFNSEINPIDFDNQCFMSINMDAYEHYNNFIVYEEWEAFDAWMNFIKEYCPPLSYWRKLGDTEFTYWPEEGRRLLRDLDFQYEQAMNLKRELLKEEAEADSDDCT